MLTRNRMLELLDFDEATVAFTWRRRSGDTSAVRSFNARFAGKRAGCVFKAGNTAYRTIYIDGERYLEHRLVWLYYNNEQPTEAIDHIDGVGTNNRLSNLRLAVNGINHKNQTLSKKSTTGYCGVYWSKAKKKYEVQAVIDGKSQRGGYFKEEDLDLAVLKAKEMRKAAGYSESHGLTKKERATCEEQPVSKREPKQKPEQRPKLKPGPKLKTKPEKKAKRLREKTTNISFRFLAKSLQALDAAAAARQETRTDIITRYIIEGLYNVHRRDAAILF